MMKSFRTISVKCAVLLALASLVLLGTSAFGEDNSCTFKTGRPTPQYPALARQMRITGVVRLELHPGAGGEIREIKILGGNPILVSAAQDAVKKSKLDGSAPCVVSFDFTHFD
jgi:TonB family protein